MSYILEALRRAEAERTAGRTPDLRSVVEAAAVPAGPGAVGRLRNPQRIAFGLLLLLLLIAASAAAYWFVRALRDPPGAVLAVPVAMAPAASSPPNAPLPQATPARPGLELPRSAVIAADAPPPTPPKAAAQPAPPPPADRAPTVSTTAPAPQAPTPSPPRGSLPVAAAPALPTAATVPTRDQLPAELRRALPPLDIGGTVYSSDPARRMLIVNGELWREGDQIRPDLVIEQIRQRDAVLRYRDLRFSVSP